MTRGGVVAGTIAALALLYGVNQMSEKPRGIRNNNPGNIRNNGVPWEGLAQRQTDPEYYQFVSPVWGIRAMARILRTYRQHYGIKTVRGIISRWAPATENDTESYIQSVSTALSVMPDQALPDDKTTTAKLIKAIIRHENGQQPYTDDLIMRGIELA